jgi:hemerythrin-like domain-containing protein
MSNVTEILSREHQVVLKKLAVLEAALEPFDVEGVRGILKFFDERLILHRRKEEEVLFPTLGKHIGTETGPIACMLDEHREEKEKIDIIRAGLEDPSKPGNQERIVGAARFILGLLRAHIQKEDNILFPMAEEALSDGEKSELAKGMTEIGDCASDAV